MNWEAVVKYILLKEGNLQNKDIPVNSPMTLYKNNMPFLFLNTAESSATKLNSEDLIDDDILVEDEIVSIKEGEPKITFEDAPDPKKQIEVRTRIDEISRIVSVKNKLSNQIGIVLNFKQTKDVKYISSAPEPSHIEKPNYKYNLIISPEDKKSISFKLEAKIITRITKIKPEFLKPPEK
ncbi:MAG: hypothetical protein GF353_03135 [Candidatus Lokiarchaeota archaeon]|nr:hypothetical protein [Candidatus Lokiarchaeota archaeon]